MSDSILEIISQGAWNGGTLVDNSTYLKKGMSFKGGIAVDNKAIEERIGIRTRMAAGPDERIGVIALQIILLNFALVDSGHVVVIINRIISENFRD